MSNFHSHRKIRDDRSLLLGIVLALEGTSNCDDTESLINTLTLFPHTVNLIDDPSINIKAGLIRQFIDSYKLFLLNIRQSPPPIHDRCHRQIIDVN